MVVCVWASQFGPRCGSAARLLLFRTFQSCPTEVAYRSSESKRTPPDLTKSRTFILKLVLEV